MRRPSPFAAGLLAVGFAYISYLLLFVEPEMGFLAPADYFDPDKVSAGYESVAWLIGDLFYLAIVLAVALLLRGSHDRVRVWSGLAAALMFLVLGALDRVGAELPALVADAELRRAGLMGLITVRFAVLKTAVLALAVFAWTTTREAEAGGLPHAIWRGLGYVVLVMGAIFVFVFVPAPLGFFVWAVALTVYEAGGSGDAAPAATGSQRPGP